jgi:hypothetical protein
MTVERRYQTFVSSTFQDLQEERTEIMQALLLLDAIPAGMELFPAANEDQWTLIKKVIDDCDYYIVVVAGRYGSVDQAGVSYTEKEYRYALERNKPILGFVRRNPEDIPSKFTESNPDRRLRLETFRQLVERKVVRYYESPKELDGEVMQSMVRLMKTQPAVGWIRADQADEAKAAEILGLKKEIEEPRRKVDAARTQPPRDSEGLAKGEEPFRVNFTFVVKNKPGPMEADALAGFAFPPKRQDGSVVLTWNQIFAHVGPQLIHERAERHVRVSLNGLITTAFEARAKLSDGQHITSLDISDESFHRVIVQLRALGLIAKSDRPRSVKDTQTYWTVTPYGDEALTRLLALPSSSYEVSTSPKRTRSRNPADSLS